MFIEIKLLLLINQLISFNMKRVKIGVVNDDILLHKVFENWLWLEHVYLIEIVWKPNALFVLKYFLY